MLVLFAFFYLLFRSHLNLLARDPSLTFEQIMSSVVVTLYTMFYTSLASRPVFSLAFIMSFFFGVFRLGPDNSRSWPR